MIAIMSTDPVAELLPHADREVALDDGARVFSAGDAVRFLFVVLEGGVRLLRRQRGGTAVVLQRVRCNGLVAEASLFAQRYHCDALAQGPTLLARIPRARVLEQHLGDPRWLQAFAAQLASEVQRARARAELLSLRRVGDRLDAWCTLHGNAIPQRGGWVAWADELGVTPEALYRELARRRR
jgi:CRP-like cAMP-binding protein